MKNLMLGTAMAVVLGASASAQELFRSEMGPIAIAASDFIGKRIYAAEAPVDADEYAGVQEGWNDIGEINDVILTRDGKVDAVLVDIGGFLGMGERKVALGMENIRFVSDSATVDDVSDYFLVVNADRTLLEGAPEFMRSGAVPADNSKGAATTDADSAVAEPNSKVAVADPASEAAPAAGSMMAGGMVLDGYSAVDATTIASEQLVGVRVYGPKDEDLGEISDVVLDEKGKAAQVIVDVGGFLGIGEKPVALEVSSMQILRATDGDALRAYVQMTQDQLKSLPEAAT